MSRTTAIIYYGNITVCDPHLVISVGIGDYINPKHLERLKKNCKDSQSIEMYIINGETNNDTKTVSRIIHELFKYPEIVEHIHTLSILCNINDIIYKFPPNIKTLNIEENYRFKRILKLPPSCIELSIKRNNKFINLQNQTDVKKLRLEHYSTRIGVFPPNLEELTLINTNVHYIMAMKLPVSLKYLAISIYISGVYNKLRECIGGINYIPDSINALKLYFGYEIENPGSEALIIREIMESGLNLPYQLSTLYLYFDMDKTYLVDLFNVVMERMTAPNVFKLVLSFTSCVKDMMVALNNMNCVASRVLDQLKYLMVKINISGFASSSINAYELDILPRLVGLEKLVMVLIHTIYEIPTLSRLPPNINELVIIINVLNECECVNDDSHIRDIDVMISRLLKLLMVLPYSVKKFTLYICHSNTKENNNMSNLIELAIKTNCIREECERRGLDFKYAATILTTCFIKVFTNIIEPSMDEKHCEICQYKTWWQSLV